MYRSVKHPTSLLPSGLLRHSFTTRLLLSLLPSNWYARGGASLLGLLQAFADDATKLLHQGVTVQVTCLVGVENGEELSLVWFAKSPLSTSSCQG